MLALTNNSVGRSRRRWRDHSKGSNVASRTESQGLSLPGSSLATRKGIKGEKTARETNERYKGTEPIQQMVQSLNLGIEIASACRAMGSDISANRTNHSHQRLERTGAQSHRGKTGSRTNHSHQPLERTGARSHRDRTGSRTGVASQRNGHRRHSFDSSTVQDRGQQALIGIVEARPQRIKTGGGHSTYRSMPPATHMKQAKPGVDQFRIDARTTSPVGTDKVWFKTSSRLLNNEQKVAGMGIPVGARKTEAESALPEREVAASLIADKLIPEMSVRSVLALNNGQRGVLSAHAPGKTAQNYIDWDDSNMRLPADLRRELNGQLNELQAFDYLIGNTDRHVENYNIKKTSDGSHRVYAIDNDLSFPVVGTTALKTVKDSKFAGLPAAVSPQMQSKLQNLDPGVLRRKINPLVGREATDALLQRLQRLQALPVTDNPKPTSPHLVGMVF